MGRYFFDVRTPDLIVDEDGAELPDIAAALEEAEASAEELARDSERADEDREGWVVSVRDESGLPQFELPVRDWRDRSLASLTLPSGSLKARLSLRRAPFPKLSTAERPLASAEAFSEERQPTARFVASRPEHGVRMSTPQRDRGGPGSMVCRLDPDLRERSELLGREAIPPNWANRPAIGE